MNCLQKDFPTLDLKEKETRGFAISIFTSGLYAGITATHDSINNTVERIKNTFKEGLSKGHSIEFPSFFNTERH